jgi:hypothetical protein
MDRQHDRSILGDVPLYLADATKSVETAPNGIALGVIELRGWQVHRLAPIPADLESYSAYLVRANYDFDVKPDVPDPLWAELMFEFPVEGVTVLDAIPRGLTAPAPAGSYGLTGQLNFIPRDGAGSGWWPAGSAADNIGMPALAPRIDCFGLGGEFVRWRHSGSTPTGTHTACFVLLVPSKCEYLPVAVSGSYHVETDTTLKLRPMGRRDAFTVRLPSPAEESPAFDGVDTGSTTASENGGQPRVFVSYAHESPQHKAAVAELCRLLRGKDVRVEFDREGLEKRRNWDRWINAQISRCDYTLVIASPAYLAASEDTLPPGKNLGVRFEYDRLVNELHKHPATWTGKILPVVLPGRTPEEIPRSFLPGTCDYYEVQDFTGEGAKSLLRVLLNGRPGH